MTTAQERQRESARVLGKIYDLRCPGVRGNPFIRESPFPKQSLFHSAHTYSRPDDKKTFECLYGGAAGGGKALRAPDRAAPWYDAGMESHVLTPKGFVPIQDVRVGQQVCNPDGTVARVIATHDNGEMDFYRVTFADGSRVEATLDHKWGASVPRVRKRRKESPVDVPEGLPSHVEWNLRYNARYRVVETRDLLAGLEKSGHQVPLTAPVSMTGMQGRWPTLPPYTIGVLLGDGSLGDGYAVVTNPDEEVRQRVTAEVAAIGLEVSVRPSSAGRCPAFTIHGAGAMLKRDGLAGKRSWEKSVPKRLKAATIADRLALVQGLMDSDGYMDDRGHVEYVSTSKALAEDVQYLVRSLGCRATMTHKPDTAYRNKGGEKVQCRDAWRLYVQGRDLSMLFSLPRKRDRAKPYKDGKVWPANRVVSVEPSGRDRAICISVDHPNGLFITDDFVVTHNSSVLLIAASQYVDQPHYRGALFRRSLTDLEQPGALLDRARDWWIPAGASYNGSTHIFTFPSGAKIRMGYLKGPNDRYVYQGSEYHFMGFDELTQWPDDVDYRYVALSRQRRKIWDTIPLRTLSTSNPGGPGHAWVKRRFVGAHNEEGAWVEPECLYIPASVYDNPFLDVESYVASLSHLPSVMVQQLLHGDWGAKEPGDYFRREWFGALLDPNDVWPSVRRVRWWDLAASEREGAAKTAGVKMSRSPHGVRRIEHVVSFRATPGKRDDLIIQTAQADGFGTVVGLEIEPGSGGPTQYYALEQRLKRMGYQVTGARPQEQKKTDRENHMIIRAPASLVGKALRAVPVSACLERGAATRGEGPDNGLGTYGQDMEKDPFYQSDGIRLSSGPWVAAFLDTIEAFPPDQPTPGTCDEVDAMSGAWSYLETVPVTLRPGVATRLPKKEALFDGVEERPRFGAKIPAGKDPAGRWKPF